MFFAALALVPWRLRVEADADHVRVRNVLGDHTVAWALVDRVRFDRTALWASLELANGEPLPCSRCRSSTATRRWQRCDTCGNSTQSAAPSMPAPARLRRATRHECSADPARCRDLAPSNAGQVGRTTAAERLDREEGGHEHSTLGPVCNVSTWWRRTQERDEGWAPERFSIKHATLPTEPKGADGVCDGSEW
ncbi:PH domain-containing protein [Micromonospora sp. M12]